MLKRSISSDFMSQQALNQEFFNSPWKFNQHHGTYSRGIRRCVLSKKAFKCGTGAVGVGGLGQLLGFVICLHLQAGEHINFLHPQQCRLALRQLVRQVDQVLCRLNVVARLVVQLSE